VLVLCDGARELVDGGWNEIIFKRSWGCEEWGVHTAARLNGVQTTVVLKSENETARVG
jgi:hypothetical protein